MRVFKNWAFGLSILILGVGFYKLSMLYSPGSYQNVEIYGFGVNENELLKGIQKFKAKNPKFIPPKSFGLEEGRRAEVSTKAISWEIGKILIETLGLQKILPRYTNLRH